MLLNKKSENCSCFKFWMFAKAAMMISNLGLGCIKCLRLMKGICLASFLDGRDPEKEGHPMTDSDPTVRRFSISVFVHLDAVLA